MSRAGRLREQGIYIGAVASIRDVTEQQRLVAKSTISDRMASIGTLAAHTRSTNKNYGKTPPVEASEARLGQVFLNVVVNAARAIAEGRVEDNVLASRPRPAPAIDEAPTPTSEHGMTGVDLHVELTRGSREHAEQMIFMSGGAFIPVPEHSSMAHPNQRVEKPFDIRRLRAPDQRRIR